MLRILARTRDFDAVVAANDYMALAVVEVLRGIGLGVPEDVAVCGFDDINAAGCATPSLTSLRQPLWQLGTQAVTTPVDIWEGRPVADCVSTPLSLIVRDSCGCKHYVAPTEFAMNRQGSALHALCGEQHRLHRDGTVTFAGAHEPPLVYRAAMGTCETIEPDGFWVGAVPDVTSLTRDASFQLADGDVLLLYTDGLTEPRNAHNEQFGTERLAGYLPRWAKLPVEEIRERLMCAARDWTNDWTDDVTLMVIRYCAPGART